MKIGLDLAEILRISKLDWRDGGEGEKKGRREGVEESYFVMVYLLYCVHVLSGR